MTAAKSSPRFSTAILALSVAALPTLLSAGEPIPDIDVTRPQIPSTRAVKPYSLQTTAIGELLDLRLLHPDGTVRVTVPRTWTAGAGISGMTELVPATGRKLSKKLARLRLSIGDNVQELEAGPWSSPAAATAGTTELSFLDPKGRTIVALEIPTDSGEENRAQEIEWPSVVRSDRPLTILGPFDGDSSTTRVAIDGVPAEILAESPTALSVGLPDGEEGPRTIEVQENETEASGMLRGIDLELAASKPMLRKGDRETLSLRIGGLEGLSSPFEVEITNRSPEIARLGGGHSQRVLVSPDVITADGRFLWSDELLGSRPGAARFRATVHSEPEGQSGSSDNDKKEPLDINWSEIVREAADSLRTFADSLDRWADLIEENEKKRDQMKDP